MNCGAYEVWYKAGSQEEMWEYERSGTWIDNRWWCGKCAHRWLHEDGDNEDGEEEEQWDTVGIQTMGITTGDDLNNVNEGDSTASGSTAVPVAPPSKRRRQQGNTSVGAEAR